ncbi:wax ester/triacylglycerol synthase domain-containing protein [Kitasatospora sp. NBC_00315]|uniref:wax ester/triacylglycerol synthase domain-containing protein n=1 Tax=Kitasatospora sp. NBC_00315 TaxID=2975963 RepID=UPI00324D8E97
MNRPGTAAGLVPPAALVPAARTRRPPLPGEPPALSVQDRITLDLAGRGADSAMHLGLVMLLDGPPPTRRELLAHVRGRLAAAPELTLLIGGPRARPRWVVDPAFDPGRHVHELVLAPGAPPGPDQVIAAVLDLPLPADRPRWGLWLVRPAEGDGYGLCYRAHHAFQDGTAAMGTVEELFGPGLPRQGPWPTPPPADARADRPAPLAWLDATTLRALLPRRREPARWSGLERPLTGSRTAVTTSLELSRLHALGRATGASVAQLCLAAATGTLRARHPLDWDAAAGRPGPVLHANLGIGLRDSDDALRLLGNRAGVLRIPLPCGEPHAPDRLEALRREVAPGRIAEIGRLHRTLFQRTPYRYARLGLRHSLDPRHTALSLADVRLRRPLAFGAAPVHSTYPLPVSVPGQPLFIAWTADRRRLHVTFLADDALTGAAELPALWHRAVEELESTAGPARAHIPGGRERPPLG